MIYAPSHLFKGRHIGSQTLEISVLKTGKFCSRLYQLLQNTEFLQFSAKSEKKILRILPNRRRIGRFWPKTVEILHVIAFSDTWFCVMGQNAEFAGGKEKISCKWVELCNAAMYSYSLHAVPSCLEIKVSKTADILVY